MPRGNPTTLWYLTLVSHSRYSTDAGDLDKVAVRQASRVLFFTSRDGIQPDNSVSLPTAPTLAPQLEASPVLTQRQCRTHLLHCCSVLATHPSTDTAYCPVHLRQIPGTDAAYRPQDAVSMEARY
eukprot:3272939-Rhodomonas_salina.1